MILIQKTLLNSGVVFFSTANSIFVDKQLIKNFDYLYLYSWD